MCIFTYNFCLKYLAFEDEFSEISQMCTVIYVKYLHSCQIVLTLESSRQSFGKPRNIKFNENPSSGSRVVPCGQRDATKLKVAFRNFANASSKKLIVVFFSQLCESV
jgi:hypothetical protein